MNTTQNSSEHYRAELFWKNLAEIQSKLVGVPKSGHNKYSNYRYSTMEDIMGVLTPLLKEYSMSIRLTTVTSKHKVVNLDGAWYTYSDVTVRATIRDAYGNSDSAVASGVSMDKKGDKAGFKANTGVSKYALRFLFGLVSTDDEPEQDTAIDRDRAATTKDKDKGGLW